MNGRILMLVFGLVVVVGSVVLVLGHMARPASPPRAVAVEKMAAAMSRAVEEAPTTLSQSSPSTNKEAGGSAGAKNASSSATTTTGGKRYVQPFELKQNSIWIPWLPGHAKADKGEMIIDGKPYFWEVVSPGYPRAFIIRNLLTLEETEAIRKMAAPALERSTVIDLSKGKATSKVDVWRTSKGMFFINPEQEALPANRQYRHRIGKLLGLQEPWLEKTQVLNYHPGEYYRAHEDYFAAHDDVNLNRGGQRIATSIVYLNDVKAGGETGFPRHAKSLKVRPGRGDAIVFYNVDESNHVDPYSMHEGRPPEEGSEKWIAVLWCHPRPFY